MEGYFQLPTMLAAMPPFDSLIEVIVYVEDMDRMFAFYSEVFGLDVVEGEPEHGFVKLDVGGTTLALHEGREGELGRFAPKLVFEVEDLAAARDHLLGADVDLGELRHPAPDVYVIDGRDPEGNKFAIEASTPPT